MLEDKEQMALPFVLPQAPVPQWAKKLKWQKHNADHSWSEQARDAQIDLWLDLLSDPSGDGSNTEEPVVWRDEDIEKAHLGFLQFTLHKLADDRVSQQTRETVMAWMMEPLKPPHLVRPFSFQVCCAVSGVDAELFREMVLMYLERCARAHKQTTPHHACSAA